MDATPPNLNLLRIQQRILEERKAVKQRREMLLALENRDAMEIDPEQLAVYQMACRILREGAN